VVDANVLVCGLFIGQKENLYKTLRESPTPFD